MSDKLYLTDLVHVNPDKVAYGKLWEASYVCKDLWNILNEEKRDNHLNYYSLKKLIPELKHGCDRMKAPCSQTLQEVVKSLCGAWKMYFTKKKHGDPDVNPPRFRSYKYFFTQKYPQRGISFEITGETLRLAYGKNKSDWIEIKLPVLDYNYDLIKNVTVSYDKADKNWSVAITREVREANVVELSVKFADQSPVLSPEFFSPLPVAYNPYTRKPVHFMYFDPGCKTSLTGIKTDGTVNEYDMNPLRQLSFKHYILIDQLKSRRDIKKRGSNQWRRINKMIRSLYRKIEGQSNHYLHKMANRILSDHPDVIGFYVGDWDKRKTLADTGYDFTDKRINRQVQNNNPIQKLVGYLRYKAQMKCRQVEKFDERGTSRTCSCCGYVHKEGLSPSVRTFTCPGCGFVMSRDINSALNFLHIHQNAVWHGLRALASLSIARYLLNPSSGKHQRFLKRDCILNYQDARSLSTT